MSALQWLDEDNDFPPTTAALGCPNGLLAAGGDLSPRRLLSAYRRGIFPWYEAPQPILWWSPDPRAVLFPSEFHLSRSLRKTLRRNLFQLRLNSNFAAVMSACGALRETGPGTWISPPMLSAYSELHRLGYAHSIEVLDHEGALAGGLYGLSLGAVFFGESMFSRVCDASKVAFSALVYLARHYGIEMIDCQVESDHLTSLGARTISRQNFESILAANAQGESRAGEWVLPNVCGGLL